MPPITRWYVKTSFIYLLLAFLAGLLQALLPLIAAPAARALLGRLEPVRVHLFVVGWITLLIIGVVFWMFPKFSQSRPRGYEGLAWATYVLLNLGLLLRMGGESLVQPGTPAGWALVISAVCQWLAGLGFVANTWQRVREK